MIVAGYDDIELAGYFRPSLSTVRQPIDAAGSALVEALIEQIEGGKPVPRRLVTELVARESTRRPPGRTTRSTRLPYPGICRGGYSRLTFPARPWRVHLSAVPQPHLGEG